MIPPSRGFDPAVPVSPDAPPSELLRIYLEATHFDLPGAFILADPDSGRSRSALVEREAAQAISETDLIPTEPVTVVLSKRGWARVAKGHEIDPRERGD